MEEREARYAEMTQLQHAAYAALNEGDRQKAFEKHTESQILSYEDSVPRPSLRQKVVMLLVDMLMKLPASKDWDMATMYDVARGIVGSIEPWMAKGLIDYLTQLVHEAIPFPAAGKEA
tara:strand:+ start:7792 stop:8145 length:354 start_codon:yes stop_codon:yes gene_type:complete